MSSHAEQLPSEIWLYIFTFLEGHDISRSFSCLNSFFNSLLYSSHLQLYIRIKQNESNERLPESTWSHISLPNISSLVVGRRKGNCLIQFLRWHAQYLDRLSSLSIYFRKSNIYHRIQFLIFALEQIPSLHRLRIKYPAKFDNNVDPLEPLMAYIFSKRSTIRNYSLISNMSDYHMITSNWSMNPSLQYLHVGDMSWNNLFSLLSFTPHLYSLRAVINASPLVSEPNVVLIHLKKASLHLYRSHFHQLQLFKAILPNLQSFRLKGSFDGNDDDFYDEKLWDQLLNNIKYFHVSVENYVYSDAEKIVLRNHTRHLDGKSWFSYKETEPMLTVFIKFKSTTM